MAQLNPATPAGLAARFRENVRLIKALRKMSDEDIARIAAALKVEPQVLLGTLDEATKWITEHPTYRAPKQPPATRTRVHRKVAETPASGAQ
jgi:hypothetical protein